MASGTNPVIEYDSGTEFSRAVNGRDPSEIIPVFDELMTTLQVLHPRLYDGVLNKLQNKTTPAALCCQCGLFRSVRLSVAF